MNCVVSVTIIATLIAALLLCLVFECFDPIIYTLMGFGTIFAIASIMYGFTPSDALRAEQIDVSPVVVEIMQTLNPDPETSVLKTWENGREKGLTDEEIMKWIAPQLTDKEINNILKVGEIKTGN